MTSAKLKFNDQELTISADVTTLGRASDNDISFSDDSNVSRYHAEIEDRFGDYWLIDLNSSNGTTVNGSPVDPEVLLQDGDQILLGGSSQVVFNADEEKTDEEETEEEEPQEEEEEKEEAAEEGDGEETPEKKPSSKMAWLVGAAGLLCGLAIVFAVAAVLFSSQCGTSPSTCEARATITKPESGETINKNFEIKLKTENESCIDSAVFMIDGKEFAKAERKPFEATINPAKHARLDDGFEHRLTLVLLDKKGNKISESAPVPIVFNTKEVSSPKTEDTPVPGNTDPNPPPDPKKTGGGKVSVIETKNMMETLIKQFSATVPEGLPNYRFDPAFFSEVQKKTDEYISPGYFARASTYKDVINEAYVKEQDLHPAIGYVLAMSRTQFKLGTDAAGEGLWRMPSDFVSANSYDQLCGENKSLSDPSQNCAAKASSLYLKALLLGVFEGDIVYAVAAYGKTPQMANIWKSQLPADRADFWNVIKTPKEREQIVRFFAAAIVVQNPQKFGLKNDRPISDLFGFILQK